MIFLFLTALFLLPSQAAEKCVLYHEWDESTGKCEWTGPKDACLGLMDLWNRTWFMPLPNFPNVVSNEVCLEKTFNPMNEYTQKVVVRRGCMFTGYAHPYTGNWYQEVKLGEDLTYGVHHVDNYAQNTNPRKLWAYTDGLTRAKCFCDPAEATVNGHVPAPPPDKKCIDYHKFNETTQTCEWTANEAHCAEIVTNDNRRMMLAMPNSMLHISTDWPTNRRYDINHWTTQNHLHFHAGVVGIIIRQHCFATLYWREFHEWKTLPTSGYGKYFVPSMYNGYATNGVGTARFVCECIR